MKRSNVLDLEEFKSFWEMKNSNENYGRYLKTLAHSQLESEINYLLDEFSENAFDREFHSKGKLILEEISSRIKT